MPIIIPSIGSQLEELSANDLRPRAGGAGGVRGTQARGFDVPESPASTLQRRLNSSSGSGAGYYPNSSSAAVERFNKYLSFDGKYDYNYRVFPDTLGSEDNAHYMVININVPVNAQGKPRTNAGFGPSLFGPANYQALEGEYSKVDQLKFPNGVPSGYQALQGITNFATFNVPRGTRRIKESIALFMPVPMVYTHTNVYEEISMTALGAQSIKLGVSAIGKLITGALTQRFDRATQGGLPTIIGAGGETYRKLASLAGYPINPKIEVMFSHTPQRAFRMELLMAPKNQKESETVKNIIDTLRYHSAPEISGNGPIPGIDFGAGIIPLFIPPAEFDITFYHKGKENTKIPRINTCAIEQIEVDYAPSGIYSTFTNGHPVQVRLSLAFRELEILHKERVTQGF